MNINTKALCLIFKKDLINLIINSLKVMHQYLKCCWYARFLLNYNIHFEMQTFFFYIITAQYTEKDQRNDCLIYLFRPWLTRYSRGLQPCPWRVAGIHSSQAVVTPVSTCLISSSAPISYQVWPQSGWHESLQTNQLFLDKAEGH